MNERAGTRTIDRSGWTKGPWDDEPDRVEWTTKAGLPAPLRRNMMGAWCGYVAVAPGHPMHGAHYSDPDVDVHGGVTYADRCEGDICHTPKPGEAEDVFWLGFDAAHHHDFVPGLEAYARQLALVSFHNADAVYRDVAFMRAECESLAHQLATLEIERRPA